jgi:Tol biopolymer transport system component
MANTGTVAGVILGTAAYMSPEQARGKPVDKRADVWSFGVLLWEMLTGRSLFAGDTVTDVIASVVKEEPDLEALPDGTPGVVRRLIGRCLRKDPRTRLPDIGAARLDLQEVVAGTAEETAGPVAGANADDERSRRSRERIWAAIALVSTGLAAVLAFFDITAAPEARPAVHFVSEAPEGWSLGDFQVPTASPDGRHLAFSATSSDGTSMLWLRPFESPSARPLPGTEGGWLLSWSPDGRSLAFFADGELRKIGLASGTVQRVCTLPDDGTSGLTWGGDGTILFSSGAAAARIYSVPATGGEARPLTTHDETHGEVAHWWPQLLPDGHRFLFLVNSTDSEWTGVHVASLEAPDERHRLLPGNNRVVLGSEHLLYLLEDTLVAQPFDAARAELSGEPVAVAASVSSWGTMPTWGWFDASPSGVLTYQEGDAFRDSELAWLDRQGVRLSTVGKPGRYGQIALSPDERRVAVELSTPEGGQSDLWTMDLARGVATRVTFDPAADIDPVWSPDGRALVFSSDRDGGYRLYRKGLQGNEPVSPLGESLEAVFPEGWLVDEETLLFVMGESGARTIGLLPPDGSAEPELVLEKDFLVDEPQVSPDGRWLAYISQESGQWEVYVEPFQRVGDRVRVSPEGGGQPKWRGDGKELFYVSPDGRLMAVDVRAEEARIEVGLPVALFAGVNSTPNTDHFAVTADGQRFLLTAPVEDDSGARIHVILNWTALLE